MTLIAAAAETECPRCREALVEPGYTLCEQDHRTGTRT